MTIALPDALAYARIPLVIALALFAGYQRPQGCFWVLLLTVGVEVAQRTLSKRKGVPFQPSDLASRVEPYAEAALYVAIPVIFVRLFPGFLKAHLIVIAGLIVAYLITELYGYFKFRRLTSYHTHGAKLAGLLLGVTALTLFWTQKIDWLLYLSLIVVLVSFGEEVAITAVLPEWRSGISSLWHAQRIVKRMRAASAKAGKSPAPAPEAEVAAAAAPVPEPRRPAPAQPAAKHPGGNRNRPRKKRPNR